MHAAQLKRAFDKHYEAPTHVWERFAELCEEVNYKKNEVIKPAHETAKYGYFLLEGACGLFVWKENSSACTDLFLENNFFADDLSLFSGNPSPIEIRALEQSKLLRINSANVEKLKSTPIGSLLFLAGEQKTNMEKQYRQIELMTKSAEEWYMLLMEQQPEILKRIHQKHIASYLGITTQSLSRIRKKLTT